MTLALLLKPRTIVRVNPTDGHREPFIARVVGTDMGRTKYHLGARYCGWNEYLFLDGGTWASPDEVESLATDDVPIVAALCRFDGVPIVLYPPGLNDVRPGWWHADTEEVLPERPQRLRRRGKTMFRRHKVRPAPGTAQTADVWDLDEAIAAVYSDSILANAKEGRPRR